MIVSADHTKRCVFFAERTACICMCFAAMCIWNGRGEVAGGGGNARCDCSCAISTPFVVAAVENRFLSAGE